MAMLLAWLDEHRNDEEVLWISFGDFPWRWEEEWDSIWGSTEERPKELPIKGKLYTLDQAMPWLTLSFRTGYGGAQCPGFAAWTKTWIIQAGKYDDSTWAYRTPRDPMEGWEPEVQGGG